MPNYSSNLGTWGSTGSGPPGGYSYQEGEQPVDEWDNFFNYNVISDIGHLIDVTNNDFLTTDGEHDLSGNTRLTDDTQFEFGTDLDYTLKYESSLDKLTIRHDPSSNNDIIFDGPAGLVTFQNDVEVGNNLTVTNLLTNDELHNTHYHEDVATHSGSGTIHLNLINGNVHVVNATGNVDFAFFSETSDPAGNSMMVRLVDSDGSGPHTVTWPADVDWPVGGDASVDEIPANGDVEVSLISYDGGSNWKAREAGRNFQ